MARRPVFWPLLLGVLHALVHTPMLLAAAPTSLPESRPAGPPEADTFWSRQEGAANVDLGDLPWISKSVTRDDIRKLLNDQALPTIASLVDLLHRDIPTAAEQQRVTEVWEQAKPLFADYAQQLKSKYNGQEINGEPVVRSDGKLGFIIPLDISSPDAAVPMPPALREAFIKMIAAGRHAGVKTLIDGGQMDLDANKLIGKIRNDIHEAVMARLVQDRGHPVHLDTFSIAELGRSDIDQTLGNHVAFTWINNQRQSVGTDGAALVQRYNELFSEMVAEKFGPEYAKVTAGDMEIVCHNADARLPDPILNYEDNATCTVVMRHGQRKLMENPEAYFFEGAYRGQVDRRSFETDKMLHSVYSLDARPGQPGRIVREDYAARDKVFQYLRPELRKGYASGVAMNNWIFFRRHKHDSAIGTLMDTAKYPLRVADEAVALKAGKDVWTFGGVEKMTPSQRHDLIRIAFSGYMVGDMKIADVDRLLTTAIALRAAAKGGSVPADALRDFEDAALERIVKQQRAHGLQTSADRLRRNLGADTVAEMGRAEYQQQAEKFMLNVVVETLPDRIHDYLDPEISRQRLTDIVEGRVQSCPNAVERAREILSKWDDAKMRERYKQFAETDLVMIGVSLRHYSPDHYEEYLKKLNFNPEMQNHFERLIFQENIAAFIREPAASGRMLLRTSKYEAVKAMQAGWAGFLAQAQALREYADTVQVTRRESGIQVAAGQVFRDTLSSTRQITGNYAKWGGTAVLHYTAKHLGFTFPELDKAFEDYRSRGGGPLDWGKAKFSFSEFVKSNIGLGQVDSLFTVLQTYQQEGSWTPECDKVFWNEVYNNIPGFGPFYMTWQSASVGNVMGIVMTWGPVYASYAYGEAAASLIATPMVAWTVYNITYKAGSMGSYAVFDNRARALFFGYDPDDPGSNNAVSAAIAASAPAVTIVPPAPAALASQPATAPAPPPTNTGFLAGPSIDLSSAGDTNVPGAPINPLRPGQEKRRAGLLDIVPGKTLDERKVKLYEWMETYSPGGAAARPYSVMQSVDTEVRLFQEANRLLEPPGESDDARRDRLKRAADLAPKIDELRANKFQEALELKSRGLAVEFLRGDLWQDKLFGPMRQDIREYFDFWRQKPDVLEHLVRLIKEHYFLGMHASQKAVDAIQEGRQQAIDAQEIWAANDAMEELLDQVQGDINAARTEEIWATDASPAEPHEISDDEFELHLRGDLPGIAKLKEGEAEVAIKTPDHPWPQGSIDSIGLLQLRANVKAPAHKFKRPFRYEWQIGDAIASKNDQTGLATLKGEAKPGGKVLAKVDVFDLLDRRVGSAEATVDIAPLPIHFRRVTLTHRKKPDEVLYQAETLDAEQKVAAGHGYRLAVEVEVHNPVDGFRIAGVGLVPASVVKKAEDSLNDPGGRLDVEPSELEHIDKESLVPPGYQYLWRQLSQRASGSVSAPKKGQDGKIEPQKISITLPLERETDVGDDDEYCLFAVASSATAGRNYLFTPQKIILRRADEPSVHWKIATLTRQYKDARGQKRESIDNLLPMIGRPVLAVRKEQKGELKFSIQGSTFGVKPEVLEVGIEPRDKTGRFDASKYLAIGSQVTELSPGEFACNGKWDAVSAALGVYQILAKVQIPTPDATLLIREYLKAESVLGPMIEVVPSLPDDDLVRQLQHDAQQLTTKPSTTQPTTSTSTAPADDNQPHGPKPLVDPEVLASLLEQAEIEGVEFESTLTLQRKRVDGVTTVGETFFARAMSCKLLPKVKLEGVYPGMKVRMDVGYITPEKPVQLLSLTEVVTGKEKHAGQFVRDLSTNPAMRDRWVNRDLFKGMHVAYLHVTVISPTGRYTKGPEKYEVQFRVQEEGLGEVRFDTARLQDHTIPNILIPGTQFWDDTRILAQCPFTITEVYGPEDIQVRHRFSALDPQGKVWTWKVDERTYHKGGGPHFVQKNIDVQLPMVHGTWHLRHEIMEVMDVHGQTVLRPGSPRFEKDTVFRIVQPRVVIAGTQERYQIQYPPGDRTGTPVVTFSKATDTPTMHLRFHVEDVPVACEMRGQAIWSSPSTSKSVQQLGAVPALTEHVGRIYWSIYGFKDKDYDGTYSCQVVLSFWRTAGGKKSDQALAPLRFRFTGRKPPGPSLQDVTVASRNTKVLLYDDGNMEDDTVNVYIDGQMVRSHLKMLFKSHKVEEIPITIPAGQDEVTFTVESVESLEGPNTAAVEFVGAVEVQLRQQGWHLEHVGDRASCVIRYQPPAATPAGTPSAPQGNTH